MEKVLDIYGIGDSLIPALIAINTPQAADVIMRLAGRRENLVRIGSLAVAENLMGQDRSKDEAFQKVFNGIARRQMLEKALGRDARVPRNTGTPP